MANRVWVGTRKGLFEVSRSAGGRWQIGRTAFLGDPVPMVLCDPRDRRLYAALGHGHFGTKLHASDDDGETWHEIACPAYPPKPDDVEDVRCPQRGIVIPWNLEQVWALEAGGSDQPDTLWCGTIPGGLFRSDDRGASWSIVRSLWDNPSRREWFGGGYDYPGVHSICVDPRDSMSVAVGVSCGGVWCTADGGSTWTCRAKGMRAAYMPPEQAYHPNIQDPHRMVRCAGKPDMLWAQHHNGVFRTINNCENWNEIDPAVSGFGFAVAVHPREPGTAWFVPAIKDEKRIPVDGRLVVTRTRDGGKSFDVLRRGLPQEHAYDLVYRHALDVDAGGDRLAFGSTTGSLWISEDQGDAWQTVNTHLPPVFVVRFAN